MRRAIELAGRAADEGEVPVGAVVVEAGRIIGEGVNRREAWADPTAHAEVIALREAAKVRGGWRLDGCVLVVTLEPCPMCAGAILNSRVDAVVYGATDPKAGCVESLYRLCSDDRFNHRPMVVGGVLAEPCGDLLRLFFRQRRAGGSGV
jgi:tRNA(adenine34) deaminase